MVEVAGERHERPAERAWGLQSVPQRNEEGRGGAAAPRSGAKSLPRLLAGGTGSGKGSRGEHVNVSNQLHAPRVGPNPTSLAERRWLAVRYPDTRPANSTNVRHAVWV